MRKDSVPGDVQALTMEKFHFSFKHVLKSSIVSVTKKHFNEFFEMVERNTHDEEALTRKIEVVVTYVIAINHNIELYKLSTGI